MREEVLGKILEKLYESQPFGEKAISIQLFSIYSSDELANLNKKKIIEVSNLNEN